MTAHARLGASKAHRWMRCPGSLSLESDQPNNSSVYADWGTDAHELAALCLTEGTSPFAYGGRIMEKGNVVDFEMIDCVQTYVDNVRQYADGGELYVEQRVSYAHITGVAEQPDGSPDSFGTADAIIVSGCGVELQVHDLKGGRGVRVEAEQNEQMMLYALGALDAFSLTCDFERVRMVIHQPRLGSLSEWDCSVEDLLAFGETARQSAMEALDSGQVFNPGDKQCRFCAAKAICPALEDQVRREVVGDLAHLAEAEIKSAVADLPSVFNRSLGQKLAAVDLIEGWCKAVRARAESELFAGRKVDGFKLVEGRRGNRRWRSAGEAEAALKAMRLKQEEMYDFKLISPTTAEKLAKAGTIGPRQWPKVADLIETPPGSPSVVADSDPRSPLNPADDLAALAALATPEPASPGKHPFRD